MFVSWSWHGIAAFSQCSHRVLTVFSPCSHRVLNCVLNRVLTVFSPCSRPCSHLVRARSVLVVVAHRSHRGLTVFSKCYRSVPAVVSQCSHRTPLCSHCVLTVLSPWLRSQCSHISTTVFLPWYQCVPAVSTQCSHSVPIMHCVPTVCTPYFHIGPAVFSPWFLCCRASSCRFASVAPPVRKRDRQEGPVTTRGCSRLSSAVASGRGRDVEAVPDSGTRGPDCRGQGLRLGHVALRHTAQGARTFPQGPAPQDGTPPLRITTQRRRRQRRRQRPRPDADRDADHDIDDDQ